MLTPPRPLRRALLRAAPAAILAAAAACAHRPPAAAARPVVPVVPPSPEGAAVALGSRRPDRAAPADATGRRAPAERAPARVFTHTPGVTWDLDVLPFEGHERVQHYVGLFTGGARDRFTAWLSRGTRYEPLVRTRLRAGGLPEDLYYLALVESGFDVHAVSHVGATGMWQFMPATARDLGLRIDWWVDERRDPVRATDGAVKMLRWLRGQFGSLFVAAAAYNGGPGRVSRGVALVAAGEVASSAGGSADSAAAAVLATLDGAARGGGDRPPAADAPPDAAPNATPGAAPNAAPGAPPTPAVGEARFFALAEAGVIAAETRNYVPQLIAAALVGKEAGRHGLAVRREAPLAYDEVRVPALTPLAAVAAASGCSRAALLDLNPHLLRGVTPPGPSYVVRVPAGRGDGAAERLADLDADERRAFRRAATRKREAFDALADRLGVSAALLRAYNPRLQTVARGRYRGRLVSGQAVRVPTAAVLAYARSAPAFGAPGALPPLPAPPPEPKATAAKAGPKAAAKSAAKRAPNAARAGAPDAEDGASPRPGKTAVATKSSAKKAPAKKAPAKAAAAGRGRDR